MRTKQIIRVNEYYDLFNVDLTRATGDFTINTLNDNNYKTINKIADNPSSTNPFIGFNNFEQSSSNNLSSVDNIINNVSDFNNNLAPRDLIRITGKINAPNNNFTSTLYTESNGNIWCYPPDVAGINGWDKIIFRNFDYTIQPKPLSMYEELLNDNYIYSYAENPLIPVGSNQLPLPEKVIGDDEVIYTLWDTDQSTNTHINANYKKDWNTTHITGAYNKIKDYSNVPLFLKFDNYQSKSKVIFSGVDKSRNPDIEFNFGYKHGANEPIKLNLSLSANRQITLDTNIYNSNLDLDDIEGLLIKCYWCVEWISYPETNADL